MSVPKSGDHAALPPPTTPAAREAWEAANLTSAAIERSDECQRARFRHAVSRRDPEIAEALHLGLGALLIPMVGPCAWQFANAELAAIADGHTTDRGRGWLVLAKLCGMLATAGMLAALIAVVAVVT
jgi:hypothetical protein